MVREKWTKEQESNNEKALRVALLPSQHRSYENLWDVLARFDKACMEGAALMEELKRARRAFVEVSSTAYHEDGVEMDQAYIDERAANPPEVLVPGMALSRDTGAYVRASVNLTFDFAKRMVEESKAKLVEACYTEDRELSKTVSEMPYLFTKD